MTPQVKTILTHLQKHGSISQAEAGLIYKIRALPRRIADLKVAGHNIQSELKRDATGQRYARYTLVPEVKTTEPRTDAPVVALNVKPKVGDKIVVVANPYFNSKRYSVGDVGTVVEVQTDDDAELGDDLYIIFDNTTEYRYLWACEVEVIANA